VSTNAVTLEKFQKSNMAALSTFWRRLTKNLVYVEDLEKFWAKKPLEFSIKLW
jgi:hypothetical protein